MADQRTSCMYDGDTFTGTFAESGRGSEAAVTVRYGELERTAPLGASSAVHAAQRLLSELVRDHLSRRVAVAAA